MSKMPYGSLNYDADDAPLTSKCSWCKNPLHGKLHIARRWRQPPSTPQRFCGQDCMDRYDNEWIKDQEEQ